MKIHPMIFNTNSVHHVIFIDIPGLQFLDDLQLLKIRVKAQPAMPRTLALNKKVKKVPLLVPNLQHPVRWRRDMGKPLSANNYEPS